MENQEEAKNQINSKFQPLWARKALIEGEFIVSFARQANHSFSGICAIAQCSLNIVNMFNYDWILIATFFNRGNRFNHHGIMMQRIMLNLCSKTCLKTFMSWEDILTSLLPHLSQTLLWKFYSCDPEI